MFLKLEQLVLQKLGGVRTARCIIYKKIVCVLSFCFLAKHKLGVVYDFFFLGRCCIMVLISSSVAFSDNFLKYVCVCDSSM